MWKILQYDKFQAKRWSINLVQFERTYFSSMVDSTVLHFHILRFERSIEHANTKRETEQVNTSYAVHQALHLVPWFQPQMTRWMPSSTFINTFLCKAASRSYPWVTISYHATSISADFISFLQYHIIPI